MNNEVILEDYQDQKGRRPFKVWLESLKDYKGLGIILTRLNRIRQGNFGDCKYIGHGVYELRIPFGPGYRVYFAKPEENKVLLLLGGEKGTQKRDVEKARRYLTDYRE